MNNIHQIDSASINKIEDLRLDQASDWIAKLDRSLSPDEKVALKNWLALDINNIKVLMEMAKMWDKMDNLSRLSDLFPQHNAQSTNKIKRSPWINAIAASALLTISVGLYQVIDNIFPFSEFNNSTIVAMQASYQTGVGESNTINLPDKSTLILNTNSFVQVKYSKDARIIELQRGEIHIDVAHNKTRPLSVIAHGKIIQAVGTAFNVQVKNELVELIVTDGKVLVAEKSEQPLNTKNEMTGKLPSSSLAISKGEKVNLDLTGKSTETVIQVDQVAISASLSWRSGNLIFRGESLAEAMAEISRYTHIKFELAADAELNNIEIAGRFKTGDVNGLLEMLSQNFNISYEKVTPTKIILKYAG